MNRALMLAGFLALVICQPLLANTAEKSKPYNVLFIAADDLRCDLACYGHPHVKTPHLDRLANRGMLFQKAYCAQALCNPSRSSLLTGRRPETLQQFNLTKHFRDQLPDVVTLPQHFKQNGYHTQGIGKLYHNWVTETHGDPISWSVPAVYHYATHGSDKAKVEGPLPKNFASDPKCECRDVPDDAYFDGRIAKLAILALQERAKADTPFFLGVGFWKPHSPFNAPKKYWDYYERDSIPLAEDAFWPEGTDRIAWHNGRELLGAKKQRHLTENAQREIRHGYLAAISYLDAQVGLLLDELDKLQLTDRTIIVFWSDHGYHLGEHTLWAKTSNFEYDARVPMMIAMPSQEQYQTGACEAVVELLDLYPTLVDLCGLPASEGLEGVSLKPLLKGEQSAAKPVALTQHPRPAYYRDGKIDAMGYSVRSSDYRYTEWREPKTNRLLATELYDHQSDPGETKNRSSESSLQQVIQWHQSELLKLVPKLRETP